MMVLGRDLPPIGVDALRTLLSGYDVAALLGPSAGVAVADAVARSSGADQGDELWPGERPVLPVGEVDPVVGAAMEVVRSVEAVKAFADAAALEATATAARQLQSDSLLDPGTPALAARRKVHEGQALEALAHEVALVTGAPMPVCRDRVRIATAHPTRCGLSLRALWEGRTSLDRVRVVWRETSHLDPVTAAAVMNRCLAPSRCTTLDEQGRPCVDRFGGLPVSHAGFRQRVVRQLELVEGGRRVAERRRAQRLAARDARCQAVPDGAAVLEVDGERSRVLAAWSRVDRLARAARAAGDERPLHQLRSDIATTLLMCGTVPGDSVLDHAPAARLNVTVSLATLLGCREAQVAGLLRAGIAAGDETAVAAAAGSAGGVGEVPGLGFLSGEVCRALLLTPGTVVNRLVTDPTTGVAFDAAATYRVPAGMARVVRARDHTCRAPGCERPAGICDLDHDTNFRPGHHEANDVWHRGDTHPDNLTAKHRGHHQVKTRGFWSSTQLPNGQVRWRSLSQLVATEAFDHDAADLRPIELDEANRQVAIEAERAETVELLTPAQAALQLAAGLARAHVGQPAPNKHDEPPF